MDWAARHGTYCLALHVLGGIYQGERVKRMSKTIAGLLAKLANFGRPWANDVFATASELFPAAQAMPHVCTLRPQAVAGRRGSIEATDTHKRLHEVGRDVVVKVLQQLVVGCEATCGERLGMLNYLRGLL